MIKESIDLGGFTIGDSYLRSDIAGTGNVTPPGSAREGAWATGILQFENAVLLLVTLDKDEEDGYRDFFEGDELHWQSQTRHTQQSPLIQSFASGALQPHLFARLRRKVNGKSQKFVYCGRLAWLSMENERPVDCRFRLLDKPLVPNAAFQALLSWVPDFPTDELGLSVLRASIEAERLIAAVDTEKDARDMAQRAIAIRRGQRSFRKKLLVAYGGRCAVTSCAIVEILEAAHIAPYKGRHTHRVDNGLPLRADIHTLFDLGLLWINSDRRVQLAPHLIGSEYGHLHDKPLLVPKKVEDVARLEHLEHHSKLAYERRKASALKQAKPAS